MERFGLAELEAARAAGGDLYHEFLRVPALSMGLYVLEAGAADPQQPHSEDEVYYITAGVGMLRVGEHDTPVAAGTLVYVPAHALHHFHSISEQLSILVFFAPAEYSQQGGAS